VSQGGEPTEEDLERGAMMDVSELSDDELGELVQITDKIRWRPPGPDAGRSR